MSTSTNDTLAALGRGIIKVLLSLLLGLGSGLMMLGLATMGPSDAQRRWGPPGELSLGVGVGLLVAGCVMTAFFFAPTTAKKRDDAGAKPESVKDWAD